MNESLVFKVLATIGRYEFDEKKKKLYLQKSIRFSTTTFTKLSYKLITLRRETGRHEILLLTWVITKLKTEGENIYRLSTDETKRLNEALKVKGQTTFSCISKRHYRNTSPLFSEVLLFKYFNAIEEQIELSFDSEILFPIKESPNVSVAETLDSDVPPHPSLFNLFGV